MIIHKNTNSLFSFSGGSFTAPNSASGILEVILTATDSAGSSVTVSQNYVHR